MDFLKTLLAYMAVTFVVAVESTATPSVTPVPTPAPAPTGQASAVIETVMPAATPTPEPTVSVTPVPVPTITANIRGYHNLLLGDRGEEVRKLQERLIEMGYLPEGAADGAFGGQTRTAVRQFQYYNGLTVDGIAGRTTQTNLFENPDAAPMPTPEPTPAPTEEPALTPEGGEAALTRGEEETDEGTGENVYEEPADTAAPAVTSAEPAATTAAGDEGTEAEPLTAAAAEGRAEAVTGTEKPAEQPTETAPLTAAAETVQDEASAKAVEAAVPTAAPTETVSGEIEAEPSEEPEKPTVTPYVVAEPTRIPWGDETEPPKETAAETPAEAAGTDGETDAEAAHEAPLKAETEETPEESAEEAAAVRPEDIAAPTGATAEEEIVEEVDLDEEEVKATQEPEAPRPQFTDLAGWVILNDAEEALQWTAEEDGVQVVISPRMQSSEDDIRLSLDDLVMCIDGWSLHDEEDSLILEAQGYTLSMLKEANGFVATVDGIEIMAEPDDFSFDEGHFVRASFLGRAFNGSWEWNAEEETLMLRISEKETKTAP
ncbi:MAG: peptidoglycan-binding protein [Clostridia bacterium]|nr:peptidoglycan-binding protein [Clostridia bacterium]